MITLCPLLIWLRLTSPTYPPCLQLFPVEYGKLLWICFNQKAVQVESFIPVGKETDRFFISIDLSKLNCLRLCYLILYRDHMVELTNTPFPFSVYLTVAITQTI